MYILNVLESEDTMLEYLLLPKYFKGMPIVFITAGILSLAFMGFSGMVK